MKLDPGFGTESDSRLLQLAQKSPSSAVEHTSLAHAESITFLGEKPLAFAILELRCPNAQM